MEGFGEESVVGRWKCGLLFFVVWSGNGSGAGGFCQIGRHGGGLVSGDWLDAFRVCHLPKYRTGLCIADSRSSGRSHILSNLVGGLMPEDVRRGGGLDHWHDEQACRQRHINSRV